MNPRTYSQIADDWDADRIISADSDPQEEFEMYRDSTCEKPIGLTPKDFTDYVNELKSRCAAATPQNQTTPKGQIT